MRYKWKKVQKDVFFEKHEKEDIVKYKKTFFNKMKLLLPYFGKFLEDRSILPKIYLDNYAVGGPNWRSIIMIIHNESIFSIKNNWRKIWTLYRHSILQSKKKRKSIIVSDFLLL